MTNAFEMLVRAQAGALLGLARTLFRSETQARCAVQEAFAAVQCSGRPLADEVATIAWLRQMVVSAALKHSGPAASTALETLLPTFTPDGQLDSGRLTWMRSDAELSDPQHIRHGIDQLPDHCRTVLLLRDGAGLDYAAIAGTLMTTESAVRTHLKHARMALREIIAREYAATRRPA